MLEVLLNHLNKSSILDFPLLQQFIYPIIIKENHEVEDFKEDE